MYCDFRTHRYPQGIDVSIHCRKKWRDCLPICFAIILPFHAQTETTFPKSANEIPVPFNIFRFFIMYYVPFDISEAEFDYQKSIFIVSR